MSINNTTWIILSVSIGVALIIMVVAFIITRLKINKIKEEAFKQLKELEHVENKVFKRKKSGELLWDKKSNSENPLQDEQMEFLINTAIRNNYKTFKIINSDSNYEKESLIKLAKAKENKTSYSLSVIFNKPDLNDLFDKEYKKLKPKNMIAVVNAKYRNKGTKKLISYLKLIKAKYDFMPIGKGVILVVK